MKTVSVILLASFIALFVGIAASQISVVSCTDGKQMGVDIVYMTFVLMAVPAFLGWAIGKGE